MRDLGKRTLSKLEGRKSTSRSKPQGQPQKLPRRDQRLYRQRRSFKKLKKLSKLLGKSQKTKSEKEVN